MLQNVVNIRKAPVPVEQLACLAGARIHYEPFDGQVSGMVYRQADGIAVIGVNSAHAITRQRFSIAHELGHLILHEDETFHVDESSPVRFRDGQSSLATKNTEIEANQFAAELLMPVDLLMKEIQSLPDNLEPEEAILELAHRFEVSEQAMTLRLFRLEVLA
jgi:Zn-dependent peptidase ImmA (M78 family)